MTSRMVGVIAACALAVPALAQDTKTVPKASVPGPSTTQPSAPAVAPLPAATKIPASYGIGLDFGARMRAQGVDLDAEQLIQGVRDGLSGAKMHYTEAQINTAIEAMNKALAARYQKEMEAAGAKAKAEGAAFLAANAKQTGVKATKSGLQYKVLKEGTGPVPKATDTITAHYKGTLLDGTVFGDSSETKQPITVAIQGGIIPGWQEALQLMKVGSKWQLWIPPELGYGMNPPPGAPIPPNAVLVFEVELVSIAKPASVK